MNYSHRFFFDFPNCHFVKRRGGGKAGDLILTIEVTPHPVYSLDDKNIRLTVPVPFPEADLGATIKVLPGAHGFIVSDDSADGSYAQSTSTVALFAKSEAALDPFRDLEEVSDFEVSDLRPWTDDYSDILGPFLRKMKKRGG